MLCSSWDRQMFSCVTEGQDHSACCAAHGLPSFCQQLCDGSALASTNNTDVFLLKYIKCTQMSSCLLDGFNLLPSGNDDMVPQVLNLLKLSKAANEVHSLGTIGLHRAVQ